MLPYSNTTSMPRSLQLMHYDNAGSLTRALELELSQRQAVPSQLVRPPLYHAGDSATERKSKPPSLLHREMTFPLFHDEAAINKPTATATPKERPCRRDSPISPI